MPPSLDSSEVKLIIIKAETPLECISFANAQERSSWIR
jgi:hypothetical protein